MLVRTPSIIRLFFPSFIWKKKTKKKEIWLTFDDGPSPTVTPWILEILKEEKIKATFFLIGKEIEKEPSLLEKIINEGHAIGNHTYSHPNGLLTKTKEYINNIHMCQKLLPKTNLFRPPYGKLRYNQIKYIKKKYKIILWDVLTYDFMNKISKETIKKNVLTYTQKGSIIVFHNNQKSFHNLKLVLRGIITDLKTKGFSFSTTW